MTTELNKKVSRVTIAPHRGRRLVCSLLPGDLIEIREKGRRSREIISIAGVMDYAIIQRVLCEKWLKKMTKKKT